MLMPPMPVTLMPPELAIRRCIASAAALPRHLFIDADMPPLRHASQPCRRCHSQS